MVLQFVSLTPDPPEMCGGGLALHPIDVCHRSLLRGAPSQVCKGPQDEFVPSATELDQAGIHFSRSTTRSLHGIHFLRGVLYIPELAVDEATEHKLLSLMAFERLHADAGANEVTAFVFFMDNVIKSAADVRLLCAAGAVRNGLGCDKAMAKMFNRLGKQALLGKRSPLRTVHGEVNAYRATRWNQWRASLIQNHAGNPWAISLPRRRRLPPRPHRRADRLHRAAVLRPAAAADAMERRATRRVVMRLNWNDLLALF
jgi:hypothetical protein